MINETDMSKLAKVKILEYIGYDERPNTYYLAEYEGKKLIMHIDPDFPASIRLFFTPFIYGVDSYLDEEELEDDYKEVFNKDDEGFNYDEYLMKLGAEQLTADNYDYYCEVQEELDRELGDYTLTDDEHEEIVQRMSLLKFNPHASYK